MKKYLITLAASTALLAGCETVQREYNPATGRERVVVDEMAPLGIGGGGYADGVLPYYSDPYYNGYYGDEGWGDDGWGDDGWDGWGWGDGDWGDDED